VWLLGALVLAALVLYVGRRPVLTGIGGFLVVHDEPRPADAIVMLSGSVPDRILEAVDLYKAHLAPRIVLTREFPLPGIEALRARGASMPEHHEENISVAEQLGVPASALAVVPLPVASTFAEVHAVVAYLRREGMHSIVLVTSKTHSRRAGMIFRAVAGDAVHVAVVPSRYDPFPLHDWWNHRAATRAVVIEYGKLLTFLLIDRWRAGPALAESK
jgi:uncharacterized SAM-binding protein YcdF (DUF218 family)